MLGVILNRLDFKAAHAYHGEYGPNESAFGGYGYGNGYVRPERERSSTGVAKAQRSLRRPYRKVRSKVLTWVQETWSARKGSESKSRRPFAPREPE